MCVYACVNIVNPCFLGSNKLIHIWEPINWRPPKWSPQFRYPKSKSKLACIYGKHFTVKRNLTPTAVSNWALASLLYPRKEDLLPYNEMPNLRANHALFLFCLSNIPQNCSCPKSLRKSVPLYSPIPWIILCRIRDIKPITIFS